MGTEKKKYHVTKTANKKMSSVVKDYWLKRKQHPGSNSKNTKIKITTQKNEYTSKNETDDLSTTSRNADEKKHDGNNKESEIATKFCHKKYFEQICRLCLGKLKNNKSELIRSKNSNSEKKVFLCCDIEIGNVLPQRICYKCVSYLNQAYEFRIKCIENNQILLKIYNDLKNNIEPVLPLKKVHKIEMLDSIKTEIQENCKDEPENVDILETNVMVNKDNCIEGVEVKKEDISFDVDLEIKDIEFIKTEEHIENDDDSVSLQDDDDINQDDDLIVNNEVIKEYSIDCDGDDSSDETEFSCDKCPYFCFTLADYKVHKDSHTIKLIPKETHKIFCQVENCNLQFNCFPARRSHVIECHSQESHTGCYDICPYCVTIKPLSYNSKHSKNLNVHIRKLHSSGEMVCEECNTNFRNSTTLHFHKLNVHSAVRLVPCPDCGKMLTSNYMKKHKRVVHSQNLKPPVRQTYDCPCCDKKFFRPDNVRSHMRTHTGDLPFKCPDCGQAFSHNVSMKNHRLKVHKVDMFKKKK